MPTPGVLRKLRIQRVTYVGLGAGKGVPVVLCKRRDSEQSSDRATPAPTRVEKQAMTFDEVLAKLPEEEKAVILEALEAVKAEAMKAADKPKPPMTPEEEAKALETAIKSETNPVVRKALEQSRLAAERVAKAEEQLAKLREEETVRKYRSEADSFQTLPGDREVIAKMLRALDTDAELAKAARTVLTQASEGLAKSKLFTGEGSNQRDSVGSAQQRAEAIAKGLREKNPSLTREQAIAQAYEQNRELFAESERESRARRA